ncbi:unnamed protein product [Auanema sp. JU1783]|nr:unnamed protein product [Auanema sp. JU1783]
MASKIVAPFGTWESEINTELFSKGNCKAITEQLPGHGGFYWIEQSLSGKRELYFKTLTEPAVRWAPNQSVQNSVHEYGGGSFALTREGGVIYSTNEGVYEQSEATATPILLACGEGGTKRFADFDVFKNFIYCVCEVHTKDEVENKLVVIDRFSKRQTTFACGADFYANPRVNKKGTKIVWMEWNHNNMPWDETIIKVANVSEEGNVSSEEVFRSGVGENINYQGPQWVGDEIYLSHDASGYWNIYNTNFFTKEREESNMFYIHKDIGLPLWQFGDRRFSSNGTTMVFFMDQNIYLQRGEAIIDLETEGYNTFSHVSLIDNNMMCCIASGPAKPSTLLRVNFTRRPILTDVIRTSVDDGLINPEDISLPKTIKFKSDGFDVTGYFYAPTNSKYTGEEGVLPPVILLGHGGPTAAANQGIDLRKQYFTSRGFAIYDVNYRGSTGDGSQFRNSLKSKWGVVDRDDMILAAQMLVEKKLVNPDQVCIKGSSAGGYLLLSCIQHSDVFKAAVSLYGVADLIGLVKDTHKFEKGYNITLLGKFPEEIKTYEERSPINHIDKIQCPIAFMHGKEDTVVPVSQSVEMYEKLKARGVTTALMLFENEGHGFRGVDAMKDSVEGTYYFLCKAIGIEPTGTSKMEIVNLK